MKHSKAHLARRQVLLLAAAGLVVPRKMFAASLVNITWKDLIPPGVPYAEIIADGERDERNDIWNPIFDENAAKMNTSLNGKTVALTGYMIPFGYAGSGVTEFMLVPYVGACIHVPPPPPNQLVFVTTKTPWPSGGLWDAVQVTGRLSASQQTTEIADVGYEIAADKIEAHKKGG